MVASLKGSLKQTFNTMGAGSDEELQADVRSSFDIWAVDPGQVIANEITREQEEELTAGEADTNLHVEQRDRNEHVNEETMVEQAHKLPEPTEFEAFENALEQKRIELDRGEGAQTAGLMSTNVQGGNEKLSLQEKEKKERQFNDILNRLQWQERLQNLANWYEKQAEDALRQAKETRQKITDNIERMQENSTFIGEVDKMLKAHKGGTSIDKEKLRQLLKAGGVDIDDATHLNILLKTAESMVIAADEENALLEVDNDIYEQEAEEIEQKAAEFKMKATEIKAQLHQLESQNLSGEEYIQKAGEIWEAVPVEVRRGYENYYEDDSADAKEKEQHIVAENEEVTVDPMAMFGIKGQADLSQSKTLGNQAPEPAPLSKPGM